MQLTVHLFDDGVTDWGESLSAPPSAQAGTRVEQPRLELDFECVAVTAFRETKGPVWGQYLTDYFDIDWRRSIVTSAVLLVRAADRWFAVTFGNGRHLLDQARLVPNFGLRVTANLIGSDSMTSIASTSLDGGSRRTTQRIPIPSSLKAFSIDVVAEWVGSLSGRTHDDFTRGVTGSQALHVDLGPDHVLKQLHELLRYLLDRYLADDYRQRFAFLDYFERLPPSDPRIAELDERVRQCLLDPVRRHEVGLFEAWSEPGDEVNYRYRLLKPNGEAFEWFDLSTVHMVAQRYKDPLALRVATVHPEGHRLGTRPLRSFLTAEIEERFVLAEGHWLRIDPGYLTELERRLDQIIEIDSDELGLEPWWHRHDEGAYNEWAAREPGFLLMDKDPFRGLHKGRDQVEVCDLATSTLDLICVKRQRSASGLSHLFSQGGVSATLYRASEEYRRLVHQRVRDKWPTALLGQPRMVYAIGSARTGRLRETLPFFSRVNLCNQVKVVRDQRMDVVITRIPITTLSKPSRPPGDPAPQPRYGRSGEHLFDI